MPEPILFGINRLQQTTRYQRRGDETPESTLTKNGEHTIVLAIEFQSATEFLHLNGRLTSEVSGGIFPFDVAANAGSLFRRDFAVR